MQNGTRPRDPTSRVVITGLGAITPVGNSVEDTWHSLVHGQSGIDLISHFDHRKLPVHIAGEVKDFDPHRFITVKDARRMSRSSQLAVATLTQTMADAGLSYPLSDINAERTGVYLGTSMGHWDKAEQGFMEYLKGGPLKANPFSIPASSPNLCAFHLCVRLNAQGYTNTVATACSAGTVAIAEAAEVIKRGRCDVMIAGGTEANINETTIAGFVAMRGLSTRNGNPSLASRPFDAERDGFILSEGCALFVLERLDHALARSARIYAEILGSAHTSDTHHIVIPDPESRGAVRAMRWALADAGISLEAVDYINAHGASTPAGDAAETYAIKTIFGERAYEIPISSTKSMVGHSFGATGAIEAVACVKSIETDTIHPTINHHTPDPACDLDYIPNRSRSHRVNIALSNSFGLGGQNSCLVLGKYTN